MEIKQLSIDVKDLDETKGIVKAYANVYNFKDSDGDISAYGSFDKTVAENFKRIRVLKDHNPTMMIGVPLAIDTKDSYGLLTTSQFNLKKSLGKDMFTDVKLMHESGLNAELSIGYKVMQRDQKDKSIIKEYKLMEYSFLSSWGANQLSTVQDIKSIKSHYGIMELLTKAYNLGYSDERLIQIETILKSFSDNDLVICSNCNFKFDYNSVAEKGMGYVECPKCKKPVTQKNISLTNEPTDPATPDDKPIIETFKHFTNSLILK